MITALDISEIRDKKKLASLAPEWWDLWQGTPTATPFQSPAWLLPWWKAFAPGELMTIAVHDEKRLVALAPFYIENGPLGRRVLPIGISVTDYIDILVDPHVPKGIEGISHFLLRHTDWDVCEFCNLLPGAIASTLQPPANCRDEVKTGETCPILHLGDGPVDAGTHPAIPSLQRRKLRMARNRLSRTKAAEIIRTEQWSPREWLDALAHLHALRWAERGQSGLLADARIQSFQAEAISGLMRAGTARLFALIIDGEMAAVYYGLSDRGRAYAYLGGFDPRFSYYSPGTILIAEAIEDALRDGAREFHFLRGSEAYKYAWGAVDQHLLTRTFVRRNV